MEPPAKSEKLSKRRSKLSVWIPPAVMVMSLSICPAALLTIGVSLGMTAPSASNPWTATGMVSPARESDQSWYWPLRDDRAAEA